jgi:phosphatidylinositol alpha-1,6-mannosyltransferase
MIGRLSRNEDYKGHREMIHAWPRVLAAMSNAELWIVGDGDLRPELERLAETLGISRRVNFFRAVPDTRKEDLLQRCRVLALPSRGEGFGLVYLEAMRLGRPCLVSRLDAGIEVVNPPEAGLAADVHDPAQLAASVLQLLTPGPEWDQMSARARRRYETHFTACHFEQRLLAALFD